MATMKGKLAMIGLVGLLAGCTLFGSNSSSKSSNQSGGAAAGGPGVAGTVSLGKEFWHRGFHVTLGQVRYSPPVRPSPGAFVPPNSGKLLIQAKFENLGTDTTGYSPTMTVAVGNNSYTDADNQDQKLPNVPGKSTTDGVIAFAVDNKFDLSRAVLTVGTAKENQAVIPLGSAGTLISLAPIKPALTGSLVLQGLYKLDITGADLTFDNPRGHQEEDAGYQRLVVRFNMTGLGAGCCIDAAQFSVKLPDGTAVAADREDPCCGVPPNGTSKPDNSIELVFKKADGSYDLIAKGKVSEADVQADVMFTITNGVGGGSSASPSSGSGSSGGASPTASGH